jgi:hypothetical protein
VPWIPAEDCISRLPLLMLWAGAGTLLADDAFLRYWELCALPRRSPARGARVEAPIAGRPYHPAEERIRWSTLTHPGPERNSHTRIAR